MSPAPAETAALADLEIKEQAAAMASRRLSDLRVEVARRARQFESITTGSGFTPTAIRDLADQVRLADPAAVEAAEVAEAEAALHAVTARHAVEQAKRPALEAAAERLRALMIEAQQAAEKARGAALMTLPGPSGMTFEFGEAARRLAQARERAKAGAERRLAELTGTSKTPTSDLSER